MPAITLSTDRASHSLEVPDDMPLLWVLRDKLNLVGTKYGCGMGLCGSCTVLVDGAPIQSCAISASALEGKEITAIEGLSADGNHPMQRAWNDEDAPQCGYCQAGQVLAAAALLARHPQPSDAGIDQAMAGILCRCGTFGVSPYDFERTAGTSRLAAEKAGWGSTAAADRGLGEPPIAPATPAITNAIFAATETGIRELPIRRSGFAV